MPRARVPRASCFVASADLPILPWLAPRVFAEPPPAWSSRRNPRQAHDGACKEKDTDGDGSGDGDKDGDRNKSKSKDKDKTRNDTRNTNKINIKTKALSVPQRCTPTPTPTPTPTWGRHAAPTAPPLHTPSITHACCPRLARALAPPSPSSPDIRGPDRASFARHQTRTHVSGRTAHARTTPHAAPKQRRQKLLALEEKRLASYVARQKGLAEKKLLAQGQYRSLRRRLLNLRLWDATRADLTTVDGFSHDRPWSIRAFAALDRKIHMRIKRHTRHVEIRHHRHCVRWSSLFFQATQEEKLDWLSLGVKEQTPHAQQLLVYLLDRRPGRALLLIQALADAPHLGGVPPEMLADAFDYLAKLHVNKQYAKHAKWDKDPEALRHDFVATFSRVFRQTLSSRPSICSQELLFNLASLATDHELEAVLAMLIQAQTRLSYDTLLHYASTFGQAANFRDALKCLETLKARHNAAAWQRVVNRQRFRWSCSVILRKSMAKGQNYHETPGIVAAFVDLGVKMDLLLYNVVMQNAMEAGDYATAFKVYNALEGNGLKPDAHTFSILLHGCTMQSNPASFRDFAEHCSKVAKETKDPWLATDYLYFVYVCQQNSSDPEQTLAWLWRAYLDFFSAAPLEPLVGYGRHGLRNAIDHQKSLPADSLLEPPHVALYIMLQAEIQAALNISNQRVWMLYLQFKTLVSTGNNPLLMKLAEKPVTWNAFLLAFCQKQQFANASRLIKDMTDHSSSPQPNIYSWNMFMQAFFKSDQVQAAERVFAIMRARGIAPDQYSYGVLLRGFAKAQLIHRIADTMLHVDPDHQLDPDLLTALAKVTNRKRLMLALEEARVAKEQKERRKISLLAQKEEQQQQQQQGASHPLTLAAHSHRPVAHPPASLPRYDAESQYRLLEQQLGDSDDGLALQKGRRVGTETEMEAEAVSRFGATLAFKSVLPAAATATAGAGSGGAGAGAGAGEGRVGK